MLQKNHKPSGRVCRAFFRGAKGDQKNHKLSARLGLSGPERVKWKWLCKFLNEPKSKSLHPLLAWDSTLPEGE